MDKKELNENIEESTTGDAELNTKSSENGDVDQKNEDENLDISAPKKIGRNDPCPCGSGKKYKQCHGSAA